MFYFTTIDTKTKRYYDAVRTCRRCQRVFIWTAIRQKQRDYNSNNGYTPQAEPLCWSGCHTMLNTYPDGVTYVSPEALTTYL